MQITNSKIKTKVVGSLTLPALEEVDKILYKAYQEKTIPPMLMPELREDYKNSLDELKAVLEKMSAERTDYLKQMSYLELEDNSMIAELQQRDYDAFNKKYREQFGVDFISGLHNKNFKTIISKS